MAIYIMSGPVPVRGGGSCEKREGGGESRMEENRGWTQEDPKDPQMAPASHLCQETKRTHLSQWFHAQLPKGRGLERVYGGGGSCGRGDRPPHQQLGVHRIHPPGLWGLLWCRTLGMDQ